MHPSNPALLIRRSRLIVAVAATTTFNSADKSAAGVLTNGDLTFKNNNGSDARTGVRSTNGHAKGSGGKWYFEWHQDTAVSQFSAFGISPTSQAFSTFTFNGAGGSGAGATPEGSMYLNGGIDAATFDGSTGDSEYFGCAVDFTNSKFWIYSGFTSKWNADVITNQDPANNIGGMDITTLASDTYYATVQLYGDQSIITANFGSVFHFTKPTGFTAW